MTRNSKIILLLITALVAYPIFFRQGYVVRYSDMRHTPYCIPSKCYLLRKPLKEIEKKGTNWWLTLPQGHRNIPYMPSLSYLRRLLTPDTDKKWACDYYARKDGEPLRSPYFGILPTEGTYILNNSYYEIKDNCWSRVCCVLKQKEFDVDTTHEHSVYKLKNASKHKRLIDLTEEDFDFLYKKFITETTIETLPFGTYMIKNNYIFCGGPQSHIISIEKAGLFQICW